MIFVGGGWERKKRKTVSLLKTIRIILKGGGTKYIHSIVTLQ